MDHPYQVVLSRDWFKLCSPSLENSNPNAVAVCLLLSNQWLVFTASPFKFNAIQSQLTSSTSSKFFFWGEDLLTDYRLDTMSH